MWQKLPWITTHECGCGHRRLRRWLARRLRVIVKSDLKRKHREMSEDPFSFLRASFYRWAQVWPQLCADLTAAPKVLGVGDLHVENFGTWRGLAMGRLKEQRAYWERLLKLGRATVRPTPRRWRF
jgi:uncharacterized protein DUF2252